MESLTETGESEEEYDEDDLSSNSFGSENNSMVMSKDQSKIKL